MKICELPCLSSIFGRAVFEFAEDALSEAKYTTSHEIEVISKIIIDGFEKTTHEDFHSVSKDIFKKLGRTKFISSTTSSSVQLSLSKIGKITGDIEHFTKYHIQTNLVEICISAIIAAAQRNSWLDEDGSQQLIKESNQPFPMIRFWDQYASSIKCMGSSFESYALDMKLRFHNLVSARNYAIPPAQEAHLLENLLIKDINLLAVFPRILQTNKQVVLMAIAHFQKSQISQEGYIANFSEMSSALRNDAEILSAACKNPRSVQLVKMLCEHLRCDEQRFAELIKKRGSLLQFATENQQNSKEFVTEAIRADPGAYLYASNTCKSDPEIIFNMVSDAVERSNAKDSLKKNSPNINSSWVEWIAKFSKTIFEALAPFFRYFGKFAALKV